MHLDKSAGSDGHNSSCNTKAEFLIAHRDELIDAAWRRIERLMALMALGSDEVPHEPCTRI